MKLDRRTEWEIRVSARMYGVDEDELRREVAQRRYAQVNVTAGIWDKLKGLFSKDVGPIPVEAAEEMDFSANLSRTVRLIIDATKKLKTNLSSYSQAITDKMNGQVDKGMAEAVKYVGEKESKIKAEGESVLSHLKSFTQKEAFTLPQMEALVKFTAEMVSILESVYKKVPNLHLEDKVKTHGIDETWADKLDASIESVGEDISYGQESLGDIGHILSTLGKEGKSGKWKNEKFDPEEMFAWS